MPITNVEDLIRLHEDEKLKLYKCTAGKLTIGVGRNIEDRGISKDESDLMFRNDVDSVIREISHHVNCFDELDEVRQAVLIDMCFNLGMPTLREFKKTLAAVERGDYQTAALEMVASRWYVQVADRGKRLVQMMNTGCWPSE